MKTLLSTLIFSFFLVNLIVGQATINLTPTNVSCFGSCSGSINNSVTGGTPPYNYTWSNGATTQNISALCAGTYTVTVYDALGMPSNSSATVSEPPQLISSILSSSNVSCYGLSNGTATAYATGGVPGYTYLWSNSQTTVTATGLTAGTYSVTVHDVNLCQSVSTVTITQPTQINYTTVALNNVTCSGGNDGSFNITVTGGVPAYSYSWTGPSGFTSSTEDQTGLQAGTYYVTITDASACSITSSISINVSSTLTSGISSFTDVTCNGGSNGSATVTPSGGNPPYTYLWNDPAPVQTTATCTGLTAGSWSVTVTDANSCTSISTATIIQPQPITANAGFDQTICANSTIALNGFITVATGGIWSSSGSGTFIPDNISLNATYIPSASDILAGNVILTLTTTGNGSCSSVSDNIVITFLPSPTATFTVQSPICANDISSIVYTGTGGVGDIYNWNFSGAILLSGVAGTPGPFTVSWNTANNYLVSLDVMSINGCSNNYQVIATVNDNPTATGTITGSSCLNNDGIISIICNGGTVPYSYLWTNLMINDTISGLSSGIYSLTVTDANSCTTTATYTVPQISFNANINGSASYSGGNIPMGEAVANLFVESSGTGSAQFDSLTSSFFTSTGFSFYNLTPGRYLLEIVLTNPASYPTLLNTYYNNQYLWTLADTINLVCDDNLTLPVQMYEIPDTMNGNCNLNGTIILWSGSKAVGEPVPGAEILIEQEPNDVPIQSAYTDINGNYTLQNISSGNGYHLLVDIPGFPLLSTYLNLTINTTDTLLSNLNFYLDTTLGGGIFIDTATGFSNPFVESGISYLKVFPNPVSDVINIDFNILSDTDLAIDLLNETGTITKKLVNLSTCKKGSYSYQVPVSADISEGIYIIRIITGNNILIKKLIHKK